MAFNKDINPMVFRQILQEAKKISPTTNECIVLAGLYNKAEANYKKDLTSLIQKIGCDISNIDASILEYEKNNVAAIEKQQKKYRNISVFAALGWILFFVSFVLKLHYLLSYKRHKKLYRETQRFKVKE